MKSSLEKFGRKLTMHKNDNKEKRDHQPSALLDDVVQASKDMQDIRNCYDGLISAAAAMTNSIFEFSESLHEMGTCLLDKTTTDADGESGRVLSTLGNIQAELQKISDIYRSYVIVTITNPSESLLSELRKVEEMKLQCDEKREAYEYMVSQHKEKGKLRSGKAEMAHKLEEAQDEYNTLARLCAFRVKSLKEGQCRSLLTQATRHHAAQLEFFRKGFKVLEAVDPVIRIVAEKHRIDYQLSKLDNGNVGQGEGLDDYDSIDEAGLSFEYGQKKQGLDNFGTSSNPMEVDPLDIPHLQLPTFEDREINHYKHQGDQLFGRQTQNPTSYSAPLYPDFVDKSEKPRETRRKVYSYVLPPPVDTNSPISRTPTSTSHTNPFHNIQPPLPPVDHEKQERDFGNDNISTPTSTSKPRSSIKNGNGTNPSIQLPSRSGERFRRDAAHNSAFDSKVDKRQAYSGPLPPTKSFSGKIATTHNGPISSTELPPMRRSVSPQPLSSPKINELHELPRPPGSLAFSKPGVSPTGGGGGSAAFFKNQEINKTASSSAAASASPLPPPPLVVSRSFSVHSSNPSGMVPKRIESPQITVGKRDEVSSPPLTPILLSNRKSTGHI